MKPLTLRDYQENGVELAINALTVTKTHTLFVAPTGSGKSYMELAIKQRLGHDCAVITPSLEIIRGLCDKSGVTFQQAEQRNIWTPLSLLNAITRKQLKRQPKWLVVDEAHHDTASTYGKLYSFLGIPRVGFTATPYRISPKETSAFLAQWEKQVTLLTWQQAINEGYISLPNVVTIPLVDDDVIELVAGELSIREVESTTVDVLSDAIKQCNKPGGLFDGERISVVTLPGKKTVEIFNERCEGLAYTTYPVTSDTPQGERDRAMKCARESKTCLLQIGILGEGVDFPVRLMADLAPTMSPVKFIQRFGRCCRPLEVGEKPGTYYVFNRNFQHHGYLLADVLPDGVMKEAQEAFPTFTKRSELRSIGIETFGKIKPVPVLTSGGEMIHLYVVNTIGEDTQRQIALVVHPMQMEPYWFERENKTGSSWVRLNNKPDDLKAVSAKSGGPVTLRQLDWWNNPATGAERYGVKADQNLNNKVFQILPLLAQARLSLRS